MSEPMTDEQLNAIEARAETATPGVMTYYEYAKRDIPALIAEVRRLREKCGESVKAGCEFGEYAHEDIETLAGYWNTRPVEDELREKIDALVSLVKAVTQRANYAESAAMNHNNWRLDSNRYNELSEQCLEFRYKCRKLRLKV